MAYNLHDARKAKKDEFYTQLTDIEKELCHYREHFRDKVVLCNCDDPRVSAFFEYFESAAKPYIHGRGRPCVDPVQHNETQQDRIIDQNLMAGRRKVDPYSFAVVSLREELQFLGPPPAHHHLLQEHGLQPLQPTIGRTRHPHRLHRRTQEWLFPHRG